MEDMFGEHRVGISENQHAESPCIRRTASLKLGISDENAEVNEEMSFKVTYLELFLYVHTPDTSGSCKIFSSHSGFLGCGHDERWIVTEVLENYAICVSGVFVDW
jgi:hypothetical protein